MGKDEDARRMKIESEQTSKNEDHEEPRSDRIEGRNKKVLTQCKVGDHYEVLYPFQDDKGYSKFGFDPGDTFLIVFDRAEMICC